MIIIPYIVLEIFKLILYKGWDKVRNKGSKVITLLVSVIIHLTCIIMPSVIVKADDITNSFLFINEVTLKDGNGNALGDDVSKSSEVLINYKFSIPNGTVVKTGDTYRMKIPKQIQIIKDLDFDLNAEGSNDVVAKVHIDTLGNVVITFTDYASTHSNVSGYFFIDSYFDSKDIGNVNPEKIVFDVGGKATQTVSVNFHQEPVKPSTYIKKSGSYNQAKNEITWVVIVNPDKLTINDVQVIDNIPVGQEYVQGSATISNGADINGFKYSVALGDMDKTGTLSYKFNDSISETYELKFKTKVSGVNVFQSEDATITQSNIALLQHDGVTDSSNNASVTIVTDFINKNGSYNYNTNKIDWVINVNNNSREIVGAKVIDNIPDGLTLTSGSVKLDGVEIQNTDYSYVNNVFEYRFSNTISEAHTITFSTDITDLDAYNSNDAKLYNNTAKIDGSGVPTNATSSIGVYVPTNIIQKYGMGYNAATGEITWAVVVNNNKINITNALVKDEVPLGQTYVEGSASIDNGGDANGFNYIKADDGDRDKTGVLTYKFNETINKTYTITFKTKVMDTNVFAANSNKNYYNTVSISGDEIKTSSSEAEQNVISEVISKAGLNYDYSNREITWQIIVNRNEMPIKNAVVEDKLNAEQEFVEGSVTINGISADSNSYTYDSSTKTFKYKFPESINSANVITFKTKIIDLSVFETNGNKIIKNNVALFGDVIPPSVEANGSITIKNSVISKTSDYADGNSYIDWNVTVNTNKIPLKEATITDNLQQGLDLDTTSVKLFKLIVNEDGSLIKGDEVMLSEENVKYDKESRLFTFNFIKDINEAYILNFRTDVVDKSKSPFSNSVSFNGAGIKQSSTTNAVYVRFQVAGGGSVGESGTITLLKQDDKTNEKLEGAVFELLDKYKNVIKTSEITGKDGQTIFNGLKFDLDYYVREKIAPIGYDLGNELYKFQVKNTKDEKNITYTFNNSKIVGNIELKKVDDSNKAVRGAEFALYKDSDINFENPLANQSSGEDGIVVFRNIDYGKYKIKEVKEPTGYLINSQIITAEVTKSGEVVKASPYIVSNKRIRGDIEFIKVSENNEPLKNAEFKLYKKEDTSFKNPLDTQLSNENGFVTFKNVEYGEYRIRETKAPEGYNLTSKEITASIIQDGAQVKANPYTVTNSKISSGGGSINPDDPMDPNNIIDPKDPSKPGDLEDSSGTIDPSNPSKPIDNGGSSGNTNDSDFDAGNTEKPNDGNNTSNSLDDTIKNNKDKTSGVYKEKLPQTGAAIGNKEWMILGLLFTTIGFALVTKKRTIEK